MSDQPPVEPLPSPPFDPPPPTPSPPTRPKDRLPTIIGLLVVVSIVAGIVALAVTRDDGRTTVVDDPTPSASRTPTSAGAPPSKTQIEAVVADIAAFVSDARDLEFDHPVDVELLDDAAFAERVVAAAEIDLEYLEKLGGVLRALGLLTRDDDVVEGLRSLLGAGTVGFYDAEAGELVVRGTAITPYVRITIAHELTHALDDQHFELDRADLDEAVDESGLGFAALTEGNALRIEDRYRQTMSDGERQQAEEEEAELAAAIDLSRIPRVVPEIFAFPYVFGRGVLDALVADGGEDRVNRAFRDPPRTSEQVIDPAGWLAGKQEPVEVKPPTADGDVVDQGVLGMWGIVLLLEDELGQQRAVPVAQGWGGDWYVAWRDGKDTCVRGTIVMDTEGDLRELAAALEAWAEAQDDAQTAVDDDRVTYEACG